MANIDELVEKILERTRESKIPWETTGGENTYTAAIPNQSLIIFIDRADDVILRILNAEGLEVERLDSSEINATLTQKLFAIYHSARRIALRTDVELDNLLEYLQKGLS